MRNFILGSISLLVLSLAPGLAAAAPAGAPEAAAPETSTISAPFFETFGVEAQPETKGVWRTRVQPVFDARTRHLERRSYTVWDPDPSRDLIFTWTAASLDLDREGKVSGNGRLTWRDKDKPAYDRASVFSQYDGDMKDGKPDGKGVYSDRTGLHYDGEWKDGLMDGSGRLVLPDGDEYVGEMRAGKAQGVGRAFGVTGETFDGRFVNGAREGVGETRLPNGAVYRSTWVAGKEVEESRRIRVAQTGGGRALGGADDVRIAVAVDKSKARDDSDLVYDAASSGQRLLVAPARKRLMKMWKGGDEIALSRDEEGSFERGVLSVSRGSLIPLTFIFDVQNRSVAPVDIIGAYFDVQQSVSDLKPAIQLNRRGESCGPAQFKPLFWAENFGWGPARNASLNFVFGGPGSRGTGPALHKQLGTIETEKKIDIESELRTAGVDVARLKAISDKGFRCKTNDPVCLEALRTSGVFGSLAQKILLKDIDIFIPLTGTLDYGWQDAQGEEKTTSSPFVLNVPLGHIFIEAECGEGGEPDAIASKPISFKLDQSNYRLPISFQRRLAPNQTSRLTVAVRADKASDHNFIFVLQLADGSEIKSRPVTLVYYAPSWYRPVE